eukprot:TRINITY_DN24284_c0_g1_i1.p1 TRINITY_DN24284_c0_g1~~TRINITY_DN24284_c0_g1_i1.p1  ORF type:complete len:132 (+),score=19.16 TRINITY_DN24284_c0_g1_i1:97-492(+)
MSNNALFYTVLICLCFILITGANPKLVDLFEGMEKPFLNKRGEPVQPPGRTGEGGLVKQELVAHTDHYVATLEYKGEMEAGAWSLQYFPEVTAVDCPVGGGHWNLQTSAPDNVLPFLKSGALLATGNRFNL